MSDYNPTETVKPHSKGFWKRANEFLKRLRHIPDGVVGGAWLLLSLYVLVRYIVGPSLAYLHSDCTDSLLWSYAMVETGEILSEDFRYAALLPFGSPLWMVPILSIFGYTVQAHILSMSVFAILFVLAAFSLFRAMKWDHSIAGVATFCLSMLLSGSVKLREVMWEHVIYYSLSILFVMLLLNLCLRLLLCLERWKKGERDRKNELRLMMFGGLLFLLCVGCATDGAQVLAVSVLPVAGALLAYTVFDGDNRLLSRATANKYVVCGVMAAGIGVGLLLLNVLTHDGAITAGYGEAYSNWSSPDQWGDNAAAFLHQYLTLFGIEAAPDQRLFEMDSVLTMLKMVCALALLVCPVLLLFRYRKIRHTSSKLMLWVHVTVSAVILLGFICGSLSSANWRLTPLLGTGILATAVYLREMFLSSTVEKRVSAVLAAVLLSVSILNAYTMSNMPSNLGEDRDHQVIARMLEQKGYDYGYATFWNAQVTTLLSGDQVRTLPIMVSDTGDISRYDYQVMNSWFEEREGQDCFLLLTEAEYQDVIQGVYWSLLNGQRQLVDEFTCNGYHVLVFDGNALVV